MPCDADFFEVDCCDISAGGLAFYLDLAPNFEKLIVTLGKPPAVTHFAAQVVRHAEKFVERTAAISSGMPFPRPRPSLSSIDRRPSVPYSKFWWGGFLRLAPPHDGVPHQ